MPVRTIIAIVWSVINLFFFTANSFSIPADIQDISDNKYFQAVHEKLSGAKGSVYIAMYSISIEPDKTDCEPYILLQDLIDAHKRGVRVEIYLDRYKAYNETKNDSAFLMLSREGVPVRFIMPGKILHDKLIVIDKNIVISGSANWSYSAVKIAHGGL